MSTDSQPHYPHTWPSPSFDTFPGCNCRQVAERLSVDLEVSCRTCNHKEEWEQNALQGTRPTILVLSGISIPIAEYYAVLEEGVATPSSEILRQLKPGEGYELIKKQITNLSTDILDDIIQTVAEKGNFPYCVPELSARRELFPDEESLSEESQERIQKKIQELKEEGKYTSPSSITLFPELDCWRKCSCERCGDQYHDIISRVPGDRTTDKRPGDYLSVKDMRHPDGAELICNSCSVDEEHHENDITPARWCVDCNVSNKIPDKDGYDMSDTGRLSGNHWHCYKCCVKEAEESADYLDMEVEYDEDDPEKYSLPRITCPQCGASSDEFCEHHPYSPPPGHQFRQQEQVIVDENLVLCEACGREWDGHAQCPCGMGYVTDTNAARLLFGPVEDPYYGEYEIDEDPPENNSLVAKEIKDTVKELGEQLFDLQGKLTEGEYLKMMDLLQKITNKTNSL